MPFVRVNNTDLFYKIEGEGNPLVLVHGWGVDHNCFYKQVNFFSKKYRVILYDHRGHGASEKSRRKDLYTIGQYARDLKGLLAALNIQKANFLGHSMGGNVILAFLHMYPGMADRVVLNSSFARRKLSVSEKIQTALAWIIPLSFILKPFAAACLGTPDRENLERIIGPYKKAGKRTLLFSIESIGKIDCRDRLGNIKTPVLIIHGDKDRAVSYENATILHQGITGSKLHTVKNGSHEIFWENREEYNRIVLEFLNG